MKIIIYPDPHLRAMTKPVVRVNDEVRELVDNLAETMYTSNGIGLASTQVGASVRVSVIDVDYPRGSPNLLVLVNPEILAWEGKTVTEEGCLSFPDIREEIYRAERVKIRSLDRDGRAFELDADGLLSVALQHEIDHLDGLLIIDRISFLKKKQLLPRLRVKRRKSPNIHCEI